MASAAPIEAIAMTTPPAANQPPDGGGKRFGRATKQATPSAAPESATTAAYSRTQSRLNMPDIKTGGRATTTMAISGSKGRLYRVRLPANAKATAMAAKAPTLILTRHNAATIAPRKSAAARGRSRLKAAASARPMSRRLTRPEGCIGSSIRGTSTLKVTNWAPRPSHMFRVNRYAARPPTRLAINHTARVTKRPLSWPGSTPSSLNKAPIDS